MHGHGVLFKERIHDTNPDKCPFASGPGWGHFHFSLAFPGLKI